VSIVATTAHLPRFPSRTRAGAWPVFFFGLGMLGSPSRRSCWLTG
jgi:hypothetical protein